MSGEQKVASNCDKTPAILSKLQLQESSPTSVFLATIAVRKGISRPSHSQLKQTPETSKST